MHAALRQLDERGFVNYFGMQRFGTTSVPTCAIGRAILRCEWKEAVALLLKPRDDGAIPTASLHTGWTSLVTTLRLGCLSLRAACADMDGAAGVLARYAVDGDVDAALQALPGRCHIERLVLGAVKRAGPDNPANALQLLPRNLRTMYVHSFQSLIWNQVATRRLELLGPQVVPGDLVLAATAADAAAVTPAEDVAEEAAVDAAAEEPTLEEPAAHETGNMAPAAWAPVAKQPLPVVVAVTEETMGRYKLTDVVLPLPGYEVQYPPNLEAEVRRHKKRFYHNAFN